MVKCFIIIKHTISYELTTLTHTMMIGQLHTSSIDLYVKHALYTTLYRLNSLAYSYRRLCRHSDTSTFFVRSRGCRCNACRLYKGFVLVLNSPQLLSVWTKWQCATCVDISFFISIKVIFRKRRPLNMRHLQNTVHILGNQLHNI